MPDARVLRVRVNADADWRIGRGVSGDDQDPAVAGGLPWPGAGGDADRFGAAAVVRRPEPHRPRVTEAGTYRVDVESVTASDRATNARYTVTCNGGSKGYTVNRQGGANPYGKIEEFTAPWYPDWGW